MKLKPSLLAEVTTATRSPEMFTLELEERNNSSARNRKTVMNKRGNHWYMMKHFFAIQSIPQRNKIV